MLCCWGLFPIVMLEKVSFVMPPPCEAEIFRWGIVHWQCVQASQLDDLVDGMPVVIKALEW